MMETNQRLKNKYKFEGFLEREMGVTVVLLDIHKELKIFVRLENVLRVLDFTIATESAMKV